MGVAAARCPGDGGGHHRVTGADFRRLFVDATGHSARLRAAADGGAHLVLGDGPDLRAAGELVSRHLHDSDRHRLPLVWRAGGRLRHRRRHDDDHHRAAAARHRGRALALAAAGRDCRDDHVSRDRPHVLFSQSPQGAPGRLAADCDWHRVVHADDHVEDRTAASSPSG